MIKKLRIYLIISSLTILVTLYTFEIYLMKNLLVYEKNNKKKFVGGTQREIYQEKKKINKNISIPIYPRIYLKKNYNIFPLSGIANVDVVNCNELGYFSEYKSDRYGFDNPDSEWKKRI